MNRYLMFVVVSLLSFSVIIICSQQTPTLKTLFSESTAFFNLHKNKDNTIDVKVDEDEGRFYGGGAERIVKINYHTYIIGEYKAFFALNWIIVFAFNLYLAYLLLPENKVEKLLILFFTLSLIFVHYYIMKKYIYNVSFWDVLRIPTHLLSLLYIIIYSFLPLRILRWNLGHDIHNLISESSNNLLTFSLNDSLVYLILLLGHYTLFTILFFITYNYSFFIMYGIIFLFLFLNVRIAELIVKNAKNTLAKDVERK